jgi:putative addiction module killer protein
MAMKEIEAFKLNNGNIPFEDWLCKLDKSLTRRITQRLIKIEEEGHYGDCKIIDSEIKELRFKFGSGYRIYFHEAGNIVVLLLCGGDKSTQNNDLQKAKEYLQIWKGQKNGK